jgi:N-acetylglucosaminyldiphosphoundecaprenol N-acetyl-beta-D-mannosaminyltransferase
MLKRQCISISILGSRIDIIGLSGVVDCIRRWIAEPDGRCHAITVGGFHGLWNAYRDPGLRTVLNSADLWVPDGIAPVWIARLNGIRGVRRVPGAELMQGFFELANEHAYSSFFYGNTDATLARLSERIARRYPRHKIAGVFSPPFRPLSEEEDEQMVSMINRARPDLLWVGLGSPKQERWIYEHAHRLQAPVAIGVGAAFAFWAGSVRRAPKALGDAGFEWLWRLALEPKKLWRRDLVDGPRFLAHAALELLRHRKTRIKTKPNPCGPCFSVSPKIFEKRRRRAKLNGRQS